MVIGAANLQKHFELYLVERFITAAGINAKISDVRESPDFIITHQSRRIGLEVTKLFISHQKRGGVSLQANESISSRIVSRAQELYAASGGPPTHISVCFSPGRNFTKLNINDTASLLSNFMMSTNLSAGQSVTWRSEDDVADLPDEISFIRALGVPSSNMMHWYAAQAGWVAPLTTDALQERINDKAKLLDAYRAVVKECWLLIVSDQTNPSQMFSIPSDFNSSGISSPFSRTFFYHYPNKLVLELCPTTQSR